MSNGNLTLDMKPELRGGFEEFVIRPSAGWRAVNVSQILRYRELAFFLAWRDVKVRYKQTVLGATWAIIQPVLTMAVFVIFFGRLGGMSQYSDHPYPIFVYSALLPWTFFAGAVSQCANSLIASERLISKVYFPRLLIPLASIGVSLVDFAISFAVMAGLLAIYRVALTWSLLLLPLMVFGTILAAVGVGTLLASLSAVYRDFRYLIAFIIQIWMFASPVAYPLSMIPEFWRLPYSINPMAGLIGGFRAALLGEAVPWSCIATSLSTAAVLFGIGVIYFRRVERRLADVI